MVEAAELRQVDDRRLMEQLVESKQELFNLRFQHVTGQLDNYRRLKHVKKDVARIRTELRRREIDAAEALSAAGAGSVNVAPAEEGSE
jgi:large subunit ribosomal protein L29